MAATPDEIAQVEGIGPIIAEAVATWLADPDNLSDGRRAARRGRDARRARARLPGAALPTARWPVRAWSSPAPSRATPASRSASCSPSHGAKVTNSISKSTSFLLAGEGGGSKRAKAEKLGVDVDRHRRARAADRRELGPRPGEELADSVLQLVGGQHVHAPRFMIIENRMRWPLAALA